jgi:hypothetical protein
MPELQIILKSFVDLFASGRSDVKVILVLCFALFTFVLFLFRNKSTDSKNKTKKYTYLFGICLIPLFVSGVVLHVQHLNFLNTTLGEKIFFISETELTSTELTHIHEMKASFGIFDTSFKEGVDMGGALSTYIPKVISYGGLFLLILALIFYSLSILKNEHPRSAHTTFYALVSFILLKNSFDGGLFNHETIALVLFLIVYVAIQKNKAPYIVLPLVALFFYGTFYFYPFHILQTGVFLICVYLILFNYSKKIKVVAALIVCTLVLLNAYPIIQYLGLRAELDQPAHIFTFTQNPELEEVYTVGNMFVYKEISGSIRDFINKYNLVDNHKAVSLEWVTCIPNKSETKTLKIYSTQELKKAEIYKDRYYSFVFKKIADNRYDAELTTDSCFSQRFENQLQEGLREAGLLPAIVYGVLKE